MKTRGAEDWLKLALDLAEQGRWTTSPNPMVGACLVKKGQLIAQGYHRVYGGPHAEIEALRKVRNQSPGATLYLTMEPCSTWGKTPPCTQAIVTAGVKSVVVSALDPNPLHQGRGLKILKNHGLRISQGFLKKEVERQNEFFYKWVKTGMPYVTLKMAQSLDGKIATVSGESRWISSPASRDFVQRLRAEQDAIMIGTGTAKKDNPSLEPRVPQSLRRPGKPWRIVLDPQASLSPHLKIFNSHLPTIRVVGENSLFSYSKKKLSMTWLPVQTHQGRLDLKPLLKRLGQMGIAKVLVEGGGELAWSLLRERLVDRLVWIVAPKIIGGRQAKTSVEGQGVKSLQAAFALTIRKIERAGTDWIFEAVPKG